MQLAKSGFADTLSFPEMSAAFLDHLRTVFPPDRLLTAPAALAAYESDALTAFQQRPLAVVIPVTQEEVIAAVKACHCFGVPFVARGSGTSLSGGSLPIKDGIVIALNRLNRILRLDPQQRLAVVEPGVINLDITRAAAPYGLLFAPDPSSQPVCTIGGNVAFNSGGAHCLKYGMTTNHVLALKVVLPDGEVAELGSDSLESVEADYVGLFGGSEGLFGIALEITVRLLPKPEVYRTLLAAYRSLEAAGDAVSSLIASGLLPGAMEIMDHLSIQAAEAAVRPGYPLDAAALLIVELEGERAQVEAEWQRLQAVIHASGPYLVKVAQNEEERAKIWKGRKSAFSAVGRLSPDYIVQDGVVPRRRLGEALAEIEKLSAKWGIRVANVFHAGDGNLHPLIMFDGREPGALARAEQLASEIIDLCIRLGGSITGEHGVGMEKRGYLPRQFSASDMAAMWALRKAIDPAELANRGKVFPGDAPAAQTYHVGSHPLERAGVIARE
jgi:glycolate oxidase